MFGTQETIKRKSTETFFLSGPPGINAPLKSGLQPLWLVFRGIVTEWTTPKISNSIKSVLFYELSRIWQGSASRVF